MDRHAGSSACVQETYAANFSCLLRAGGNAKRKEPSAKRKDKDFLSHEFPPQCFEAPCSLPLAPCYLITRSARASTFGGIVRPIRFAVFKLITNSNFVGRSTGISPALVPLMILSISRAD